MAAKIMTASKTERTSYNHVEGLKKLGLRSIERAVGKVVWAVEPELRRVSVGSYRRWSG
jgi:hypothetical protein